MSVFGILGFSAPLFLWGLLVLPVLWVLLRATPPAPARRVFPAVSLLLGLRDADSRADRTPWWLLLLRIFAVAGMIIGIAGPVLNPQKDAGAGAMLIVLDGSWASARDWEARQTRVAEQLESASRAGREVALVVLTDPPAAGPVFQPAAALRDRVGGLRPAPHAPDETAVFGLIDALGAGGFESLWFTSGAGLSGADARWRPKLLAALSARGNVTVFQSETPLYALLPPAPETATSGENSGSGRVSLVALRADAGPEVEVGFRALGPDPSGREAVLGEGTFRFDASETRAETTVDLQAELRNRVSRFVLVDQATAGATVLADDALRRREIAVIESGADAESPDLLDPLYYLRRALEADADVLDGSLTDILPANPDMIVLADVATLTGQEENALADWVRAGGTLLRFAGPRIAASDLSRAQEDRLMPVRLRRGGRTVGGAMSWGAPRGLQPFAETSPFYGLPVPDEVQVTSQVVAQPDPELSGRVIAALRDGTPLVTRKPLEGGWVVFFHVTANAEWSSLPLSGLFVEMLGRLAATAGQARPNAETLAGTLWQPELVLDGFGRVGDAGALAGVPGETLATGRAGPDVPPGVYRHDNRSVALNVLAPGDRLSGFDWPVGTVLRGFQASEEYRLKGWVLLVVFALLMLDGLASLLMRGKVRPSGRHWGAGKGDGVAPPRRASPPKAAPRRGHTAAVLLAVFGLSTLLHAQPLAAQERAAAQNRVRDAAADARALARTSDVVLAYVETGNREIDRRSEAGLRGLSRALTLRTSIEPVAPVAVNPEVDELAFFPFLYWPVTRDQARISDAAYQRLNRYLRTGGMILFDTLDAGHSGTNGPNRRALQRLARPLDLPPLEPIPEDHVLTRAFYLLQDFPGRFVGQDVWVEAAPPGAARGEGMPFRNLNDGVTPVIIGGNDWAGAWAVTAGGRPLLPVGRGRAGERQREISLRFGINLIMHALTGNYKSDQVHVPALLDRLGQ